MLLLHPTESCTLLFCAVLQRDFIGVVIRALKKSRQCVTPIDGVRKFHRPLGWLQGCSKVKGSAATRSVLVLLRMRGAQSICCLLQPQTVFERLTAAGKKQEALSLSTHEPLHIADGVIHAI